MLEALRGRKGKDRQSREHASQTKRKRTHVSKPSPKSSPTGYICGAGRASERSEGDEEDEEKRGLSAPSTAGR